MFDFYPEMNRHFYGLKSVIYLKDGELLWDAVFLRMALNLF